MRLTSIGTSPQSNIVLTSQYASRNHAELIQLANGDMLLVDKGSSNGTFVNGSKIAPNTEVLVTRADAIFFADQQFNWSVVQPLPPLTDVKAVKGIGTHYRNSIRIQGSHVSRFHATIKQTKDGKWYICDHSSNGTTVNGNRIPKDQYVPIKKGDVIACAGVGVVNPVTSGGGNGAIKGIVLGLCACLLVGVGVFAAMKFSRTSVSQKDQPKTTVLIETIYYYRAHVDNALYSENYDVRFGQCRRDVKNKNGKVIVEAGEMGEMGDVFVSIGAYATGFFLDKEGVIVTNDHVVRPWCYQPKLVMAIRNYVVQKVARITDGAVQLASADVQVDGVLQSIRIIPNGKLYAEANKIDARYLMSVDNSEVDLALIQTMDKKLPEGATYVPVKALDDNVLGQDTDIHTFGFPIPQYLQDMDRWERFGDSDLQAVFAHGKITKVNKYDYMHNADSYHGASGSPVFDKKGKLVGVVSKGNPFTNANYNHCVKSKLLVRLYAKWLEENRL